MAVAVALTVAVEVFEDEDEQDEQEDEEHEDEVEIRLQVHPKRAHLLWGLRIVVSDTVCPFRATKRGVHDFL